MNKYELMNATSEDAPVYLFAPVAVNPPSQPTATWLHIVTGVVTIVIILLVLLFLRKVFSLNTWDSISYSCFKALSLIGAKIFALM